jgi:hypothetical protein
MIGRRINCNATQRVLWGSCGNAHQQHPNDLVALSIDPGEKRSLLYLLVVLKVGGWLEDPLLPRLPQSPTLATAVTVTTFRYLTVTRRGMTCLIQSHR